MTGLPKAQSPCTSIASSFSSLHLRLNADNISHGQNAGPNKAFLWVSQFSRRCWTELLLSLGNLSIAKRLVGAKFHKEVSIVSVRKGNYSWPEIARMGLTE